MPLYNRLKEHRARLGVNQQEMARLEKNRVGMVHRIYESRS